MTLLRSSIGLSLLTSIAGAQSSEVFLASYSVLDAYVVQNGQIVRQFNRTSSTDGPGLVVHSTIKMYGQAGGNVGREYDLNGNLLLGQYPNPGFVDCYDGATDGVGRNWTISHNDFSNNFAVLVGDLDWNNVQVAFVPNRRSSGIAYDATDDTLWITNNVGGTDRVQHYTTTGTFLGEFAVSGLGNGGGYGLALDPADQTLWITGAFGTTGVLTQYSKAGALLQSVNVPGLTTNVLSAEFQASSPFTKYCTANANSTGAPADLSASGSTSSSAGDLTLTSAPVPNQNGIFFHGMNQTQIPFGNGFMCTSGGIVRGAVVPGVANSASYTYDNSDAQHSLANFIGTTRNFQHWFRDPMGGGSLFNTSNALSIGITP